MKKLYHIIILILASTSFVFAQNAAETLMNKGQGIVLGGWLDQMRRGLILDYGIK